MAAPPPEVTAAMMERVDTMRASLLEELARFVRAVLQLVRDSGEEAVPDAVEQIVDAVEAGRREMSDLTEVYVETVLAIDGKTGTEEPVGTGDHDTLIEQWTDLVDRYVREADEDVIAEAERILADDIEDAHRTSIDTPTAIGYRRVIHPELSAGGTCGLCVAASHRFYHVRDLDPIHDRCKCTVLPVTEDADPGKDLNDADLQDVYRAAGTTDGPTLKQARFRVDEDGDLVTVKARKKRGPVNARDGQDREYDQASGLSEKSADWLRHQIEITEALKPSDWRDKQLRRLRDELARR